MKPHWLLIGGVAVFVCLILYVLFRDRVTTWWTRVSNTEGGKRALQDIGNVEEWIKRNRSPAPPRPPPQQDYSISGKPLYSPEQMAALTAAANTPRPVVAAPIAAADPPPAAETSPLPGPAAPTLAAAAPSAIGGTLVWGQMRVSGQVIGAPFQQPAAPAAQQEKSMAYVPKYPPPRQAPAPSAILMLRGFKTYAALAQNFLDIANEAVKFAYYNATPGIHPLQDYLGISAGWINAMDYDCLVDGVLLKTCRFDAASGAVIINGHPIADPAISWATADGGHPAPYKPLRHVDGTGADLLAAFLHAGTQSSYLKSLGLTDEAIAAAR